MYVYIELWAAARDAEDPLVAKANWLKTTQITLGNTDTFLVVILYSRVFFVWGGESGLVT